MLVLPAFQSSAPAPYPDKISRSTALGNAVRPAAKALRGRVKHLYFF